MEGSLYRKFSISRGKGEILGPDPKNSIAGNRVFCLAGILGNGVPSSGDPEAGVMSGVCRYSIEYFSPTRLINLQLFIVFFFNF